jgi:hypothetical protein
MKNVSVKIFPNCGNPYQVIVTIDSMFDDEEQIDIWIEENLKDVASWEWV